MLILPAPNRPPARGPAVRTRPYLYGTLAGACCLACTLCAAQEPSVLPAGPGWVGLDTDLVVGREVIDSRWSALVRRPDSRPEYSLAGTPHTGSWSRAGFGGGLLSYSPPHVASATTAGAQAAPVIARPQFALGSSSSELRSWLQFAGIDATGCMAPVMKMHSTFAGSTSHAKVSLSARCSTH